MRSSRSSETCRARSPTTAARVAARGVPSRRISWTRAFDTRCRAASIAPKTPASGTRQTAITRAVTAPELIGTGSPGPGLPGDRLPGCGAPALDQLLLEAEHLLLLLRLHVVVTEQVQDAVGGEQDELVVHRVPGGAGLPDGDRRAQDDVAEQRRAGLGVVGSGG